MKKDVRGFLTNAHIATPDSKTVSPVLELSRLGHTYAKRVQTLGPGDEKANFLSSFGYTDETELTDAEASFIIDTIWSFIGTLVGVIQEDKMKVIANFTKMHNSTESIKLESFNYNSLVPYDGDRYPDYVTFTTKDLSCSVWLTNETFTVFYPLYEINVIPPFPEFPDIVKCAPEMLEALGKFDAAEFVNSLNDYNEGVPTTMNRSLNIHYRATKESPLNDCFFGFNIWGIQGLDEFILKDAVYDYLSKDLGLSDEFIEEHFPTLFQVNEFWLLPDWENYAIPFTVGQGSINSHMAKAWSETYPISKYIRTFENKSKLLKDSTYYLPIRYNNTLIRVVNGQYSREGEKDFREYYHDFIDVSTESLDFSRMSQRTQHFSIFLKQMIYICDAENQTELLNKIMKNTNPGEGITKPPTFRVSPRKDVVYVSAKHGEHRYYMIPRYEHERCTLEHKEIK